MDINYKKLFDELSKPRPIKFYDLFNYSCIKCNIVERKMIKLGVLTFCELCAIDEFGDLLKFNQEKYSKWLGKYKNDYNI